MPFSFSFNELEILSFFTVLVRLSVLVSLLPWLGDRVIPGPVKVLLALAITFVSYPALVNRGLVRPVDAATWGATPAGIIGTVLIEITVGLLLGFVARLAFDAIQLGSNLVGSYMGFASASQYDPHQENQSQLIAQFQGAIAMLVFLVFDGHHMMLRACLSTYEYLGVGTAVVTTAASKGVVTMTGQVIQIALILSAPVAVVIFGINVAFGMVARALPQTNILVLSFAVTTIAGFSVLFLSLPEFTSQLSLLFERSADWIRTAAGLLGGK